MSMNENGVSTTVAGCEQFESFRMGRRTYVQYDFRTVGGKLFSCVKRDLAECRRARDAWVKALADV